MNEEIDVERQPAAAVALSADELGAVRELALRAHPEVVPELVRGVTVAELLASLEPASHAYRRIVERTGASPAPRPPVVPAGTQQPVAADPDTLPAAEKIRRALAQRRSE